MEVIKYPDLLLKKKLNPVVKFDKSLSNEIKEMFKLLNKEKGIGLAANQAGLDKSMFVMQINSLKRLFINPKLKVSGELVESKEGCLSFPGIEVDVSRFSICEIEFQNLAGVVCKETFTGLPAIVCQHEHDHLIGKTFIDTLDELTKEDIRVKLLSK